MSIYLIKAWLSPGCVYCGWLILVRKTMFPRQPLINVLFAALIPCVHSVQGDHTCSVRLTIIMYNYRGNDRYTYWRLCAISSQHSLSFRFTIIKHHLLGIIPCSPVGHHHFRTRNCCWGVIKQQTERGTSPSQRQLPWALWHTLLLWSLRHFQMPEISKDFHSFRMENPELWI